MLHSKLRFRTPSSVLRTLAASALRLAAIVAIAGCATSSPSLQIQENERLSTVYQQQGNQELARLYQARADQARAAERRKDPDVLSSILEALFSISFEAPASGTKK